MKKIIFLCAIFFLCLCWSNISSAFSKNVASAAAFDAAQADSSPVTVRKLPFKTAVIVYQYQGGQQGKEVVYIDVAKNRIDQENEISVQAAGQTVSKKDRKMYDGKNFYEFIYKENMVIQYLKRKDAIDLLFQGKDIMENYQYAGASEVLGKKLKVYKSAMELSGLWNGIELKKKLINNPFGEQFNYVKTAIKITFDVPIPEEKFQVPVGMTILTEEQALKKTQEMFQALGNKIKRS